MKRQKPLTGAAPLNPNRIKYLIALLVRSLSVPESAESSSGEKRAEKRAKKKESQVATQL